MASTPDGLETGTSMSEYDYDIKFINLKIQDSLDAISSLHNSLRNEQSVLGDLERQLREVYERRDAETMEGLNARTACKDVIPIPCRTDEPADEESETDFEMEENPITRNEGGTNQQDSEEEEDIIFIKEFKPHQTKEEVLEANSILPVFQPKKRHAETTSSVDSDKEEEMKPKEKKRRRRRKKASVGPTRLETSGFCSDSDFKSLKGAEGAREVYHDGLGSIKHCSAESSCTATPTTINSEIGLNSPIHINSPLTGSSGSLSPMACDRRTPMKLADYILSDVEGDDPLDNQPSIIQKRMLRRTKNKLIELSGSGVKDDAAFKALKSEVDRGLKVIEAFSASEGVRQLERERIEEMNREGINQPNDEGGNDEGDQKCVTMSDPSVTESGVKEIPLTAKEIKEVAKKTLAAFLETEPFDCDKHKLAKMMTAAGCVRSTMGIYFVKDKGFCVLRTDQMDDRPLIQDLRKVWNWGASEKKKIADTIRGETEAKKEQMRDSKTKQLGRTETLWMVYFADVIETTLSTQACQDNVEPWTAIYVADSTNHNIYPGYWTSPYGHLNMRESHMSSEKSKVKESKRESKILKKLDEIEGSICLEMGVIVCEDKFTTQQTEAFIIHYIHAWNSQYPDDPVPWIPTETMVATEPALTIKAHNYVKDGVKLFEFVNEDEPLRLMPFPHKASLEEATTLPIQLRYANLKWRWPAGSRLDKKGKEICNTWG